ncbi:MAG: hypothetical protein AAFR67_05115 [Chloroflexota bacterium]
MRITTEWLVQDRVLYSHFTGRLTVEDVRHWLDTLQRLTCCTEGVHHISNGLAIEGVDFSLTDLQRLMRYVSVRPTIGWHIEVTTNSFHQMLSSLGCRFLGVKTKAFPDVESAINFLMWTDPSLNTEQPHTSEPDPR